jgi:hypothetical protein
MVADACSAWRRPPPSAALDQLPAGIVYDARNNRFVDLDDIEDTRA